jgi:hypothetical protein
VNLAFLLMMKRTFGSDQTITSYLLNELSEEDQERFEEAYLSDPGLFEQVQALEEELIEDYVKGDLSGQERRRFERHYLASDQRRARIEAARELLRVCSLKTAAQTDGDDRIKGKFFSLRSRLRSLVGLRPATVFGVAVALLSLLGAGLGIELLRLQGQLAAVSEERAAVERRAEESDRRLIHEREQLDQERKQGVGLREKLVNLNNQLNRLVRERVESQASENRIVPLRLTPTVRNIDNPAKAVLLAHTSFVRLRVELERQETANLPSCRAVVKAVDGGEIWTQEGIKPRRRKSPQDVILNVPADRFKAAGAQDFTLTLYAPTAGGNNYEELERYYFQVIANRH